ncbi:MAG TPA: PIN domain-containing protein [Haliangiales bacterium]|nr:PIN domain-containing protein [Haliangiales bacterium]
MRACFYDTWAFLALSNASDPAHAIAVEADAALERDGWVIVTSDYVIDEAVTGLNAAAGPRVAVRFLDLVDEQIVGEEITLFPIDPARRSKAGQLFRRLAPQAPKLSFTDCTSLVLMAELKIPVALTADRHFHGAGKNIRPLVSLGARGRLRLQLP